MKTFITFARTVLCLWFFLAVLYEVIGIAALPFVPGGS